MNKDVKMKNIISPHKIAAPVLSSTTYGADIEDVFRNIDENFSKLVNSDFLRGHQGDSLFVKAHVMEDVNDDVFDAIREAIYHKYASIGIGDSLKPLSINNGEGTRTIQWWDYLIQPSNRNRLSNVIYMVHALTEVMDESGFTGNYSKKNVSSLPFVIKDARFGEMFESGRNYGSNDMEGVQREDVSCIVQFTGMVPNPYYNKSNPYFTSIHPGAVSIDERKEIMHFEILDVFPTLYYDAFQQNFCWKVWGDKTGIIANGPKGVDGKPGSFVLVVRDYFNKDSSNSFYVRWLVTEDGSTVGIEENTANLYNGAMAIVLPDNGEDKKLNNGSYWIGKLKNINGKLKVNCSEFNRISPKFDSRILTNSLIDRSFPGYYIPTEFGVNDKGTSGYIMHRDNGALVIDYIGSYSLPGGGINTTHPIKIYGPVELVCGDVSLRVSNSGVQIGKGGKFENIVTTHSAL